MPIRHFREGDIYGKLMNWLDVICLLIWDSLIPAFNILLNLSIDTIVNKLNT